MAGLVRFLAAPLGKALLVFLVAAALTIMVRSCTSARQQAAQAEQDSRDAGALAETAKDAAATVIDQAGEEATLDELAAATAAKIHAAADDETAHALAVQALCDMPSFAGDPQCRGMAK